MKKHLKTSIVVSVLGFIFFGSSAFAVPAGLSFQGRLVDNGQAVENSAVTLTLTVTSPSPDNCVLYEETHSLNMTDSDGIFSVKVGGGSRTGNDKGFSLTQVFSNTGTPINSLSCVGAPTSYTSATTDSRNIFVSFNYSSYTVAFASPYVVQAVPYAIEAERLAGKPASGYLQTTTDTTQTKLNDIMVPSTYTDLLALLNGTSSKYMTSSTSAPATMPILLSQPSSPTEGQFWYHNGDVYYRTGSQTKTIGSGTVTGITAGTGLAGGTINTSGTIDLASNVIGTPGTYQSVTVDTHGRVTAGTNPTTLNGYGITDAVVKGGQTGALTLGTSDSNALTLNTNNSAKMTILPNGNVGIGTTSPGDRLTVGSYETPAFTTNQDKTVGVYGSGAAYFRGRDVTNDIEFIMGTSASGYPFIASITNHPLVFRVNNGTEVMRLGTTGNVGIGTASPTAKLEVQGQIVSKQATISSGATVNFANGNSQALDSVGGTVVTLQNIVFGATYNLIIRDTTSRTYTFSGCTTSYFNPTNGPTMAGTRSIYTIMTMQNGSDTECYISWITGFN